MIEIDSTRTRAEVSDAATETQCEIDRLKRGFMNTLARDIRLPLTNVLGLLELFESKLRAHEPFDSEDRQLLSSAIENGDRMRRILDDHLEIAQQHERPLALKLKHLEAAPLLEAVAEPLRGEAALRGVELNVRVAPPTLSLYADERETHRAISHLLTTALAATPDGGAVKIEAQTILGTRAGDDGRCFIVINISDSSAGISAEEVPFVFDAFWQASNSGARAGRGVGLAIAKRIAAAHGGNVSVHSQLGKGTIYSIVLPVSQRVALSDLPGILIAGDWPETLPLLRKLIARMGYCVETASDGHVALKVLRENFRFDLLITDWDMPGMNGRELIASLKRDQRLKDIPVIALTSCNTAAERSEAATAATMGCARLLVKPLKRDDLQRAILELLPTTIKSG